MTVGRAAGYGHRASAGRLSAGAVPIAGTAVAIGVLALLPFLRSTLGVGIAAYLVPVLLLGVVAVVRASAVGTFSVPPAARSYLAVFTVLSFWLAASALWGRTGVGFADDLGKLGGIFVLVALTVVALSPRALEKAEDALVIVGLIVAVWVFGAYLAEGTLRGYGALGERYLVVSQAIGIGAVLASVRWICGHRRAWSGLAAVALLAALSLSLARGALISTVLIVFACGLYVAWRKRAGGGSLEGWVRRQAGRIAIVSVITAAVAAVVYGAFQVERTRERLVRMISGRELEGGRGTAWAEAWQSVGEAPLLGHGLGSSGIMSGVGEDLYPHNWALQVWLDAGVIGFVLCALTLAIPVGVLVWRAVQKRAGPPARWLPLLGTYVFLVLEYSKSSDFYAGRTLFVVGVMLVCIPAIANDQTTEPAGAEADADAGPSMASST